MQGIVLEMVLCKKFWDLFENGTIAKQYYARWYYARTPCKLYTDQQQCGFFRCVGKDYQLSLKVKLLSNYL